MRQYSDASSFYMLTEWQSTIGFQSYTIRILIVLVQ